MTVAELIKELQDLRCSPDMPVKLTMLTAQGNWALERPLARVDVIVDSGDVWLELSPEA